MYIWWMDGRFSPARNSILAVSSTKGIWNISHTCSDWMQFFCCGWCILQIGVGSGQWEKYFMPLFVKISEQLLLFYLTWDVLTTGLLLDLVGTRSICLYLNVKRCLQEESRNRIPKNSQHFLYSYDKTYVFVRTNWLNVSRWVRFLGNRMRTIW